MVLHVEIIFMRDHQPRLHEGVALLGAEPILGGGPGLEPGVPGGGSGGLEPGLPGGGGGGACPSHPLRILNFPSPSPCGRGGGGIADEDPFVLPSPSCIPFDQKLRPCQCLRSFNRLASSCFFRSAISGLSVNCALSSMKRLTCLFRRLRRVLSCVSSSPVTIPSPCSLSAAAIMRRASATISRRCRYVSLNSSSGELYFLMG